MVRRCLPTAALIASALLPVAFPLVMALGALLFSLGFVIATGLLHLAGILLGETRRWPRGRAFVRGAGGAVALAGLFFLERALV